MTTITVEPDGTTWLDLLSVLFSGLAALGGVVAVVIAVRALRVSRKSAAVEQLFTAAADAIAALQDVDRTGMRLRDVSRSRDVLSESFLRFESARARVDLALDALGTSNTYRSAVLDIAHNFAVSVLQADEFSQIGDDLTRRDLEDPSWVEVLPWACAEDVDLLARSVIFREVRYALELAPAEATDLNEMTERWGLRVLRAAVNENNVYSTTAPYITQVTRLVSDFTAEYVQPMLAACVREVSS